jgi:hypothetical protein
MGPDRLHLALIFPPVWLVRAAGILLTLGLLGFAAVQLRKRNWVTGFLLLWFLVLLAPVLPLRDHLSDYYLTMPLIGLAMLAGWAVAAAWRSRWYARTAAVVLAAVYLASSLPVARAVTRWHYDRSRAARTLVLGLARAHELHPDKTILLTGVTSELFWSAIADKAYRLVGIGELHLAPGSEQNIQAYDEVTRVSDFVLPEALTLRALEQGRAVVYAVGEGRPRNVTSSYLAAARALFVGKEEPFRIDAGSPLFAGQLGPAWYQIEGAYRWMPKRASVFLHGPVAPGTELRLSGFCPAEQVKTRPLTVTASVDGVVVGKAQLSSPNAAFDLAFPMPAASVGKAKVEVAIEVDRTFVAPADGRQLGLVFGTIAIR